MCLTEPGTLVFSQAFHFSRSLGPTSTLGRAVGVAARDEAAEVDALTEDPDLVISWIGMGRCFPPRARGAERSDRLSRSVFGRPLGQGLLYRYVRGE
jgi:hypothetical protein